MGSDVFPFFFALSLHLRSSWSWPLRFLFTFFPKTNVLKLFCCFFFWERGRRADDLVKKRRFQDLSPVSDLGGAPESRLSCLSMGTAMATRGRFSFRPLPATTLGCRRMGAWHPSLPVPNWPTFWMMATNFFSVCSTRKTRLRSQTRYYCDVLLNYIIMSVRYLFHLLFINILFVYVCAYVCVCIIHTQTNISIFMIYSISISLSSYHL